VLEHSRDGKRAKRLTKRENHYCAEVVGPVLRITFFKPFAAWQGFGESGVPQFSGERVTVAETGAAMDGFAGRDTKLAANSRELRNGILASFWVLRLVLSSNDRATSIKIDASKGAALCSVHNSTNHSRDLLKGVSACGVSGGNGVR
jgi:hypothetical protein